MSRAMLLLILTAMIGAVMLIGLLMQAAWPHDLAAWSDPARDDWYRSLKVPGKSTSCCCNMRDAAYIDPDKVRQDSSGTWFVDLGQGYVPVPRDRVVRSPASIDGMPYVFLMFETTPENPGGIRCFVPSIPTY